MKILFVAPRFHTNLVQLIKMLQEKNHQVYFHVATMGPTEDHNQVTPINYKQSKLSRLLEKITGKGVNARFYFPRLMHYWKAFKALKPDMVVIRDPYKLFPFTAALYARLLKAKIVFYTQEDLFRPRTKKTVFKQKLMLRFFKAAWMTPIKSNGKEKNDKIGPMYYIPLPVVVEAQHNAANRINGDGPKLLMIGKYHQERKKHLLFLKALSQLKDKYPFKVTIAGECANDEQRAKLTRLQDAVNDLGLTDRIEFKQNVPYKQMPELYASHHVFVLPAINEQYGVSVNEALGYGLPVICTDTCGAKFNICNGDNGFVVKSNSSDDLATALENVIRDNQRLNQMRENSLQYAKDNLSKNIFYLKFSNLVSERFSLSTN